MENKNEILNELQQDFPLLATVVRNNVYTVADNYFNELLNTVATTKTISGLSSRNPYSVPSNYFENFSANILQKIKAENAAVPVGYFDAFAHKLMQRIRTEQADETPLLESISNENVYTVPDGYFESLEIIIPAKAAPAKVVKLRSRVMQYAVAACTAGVLAVSALFVFNKNNNEQVISYKDAVNMDINTATKNLSDDEINNYLSEAVVAGYSLSEEKDFKTVDEEASELSDEEINNYLKEEDLIFNES